MKSLARPRTWIALLLSVAAGTLAYHWPMAPRAVIACEHQAWHLAFSRDGTKLAILDREAGVNQIAQVLICDAATGAIQHRLDHGIKPYPHKVVFAPDGKTLGVVDVGAVAKWDLDAERVLAHYQSPSWSSNANSYAAESLAAHADRCHANSLGGVRLRRLVGPATHPRVFVCTNTSVGVNYRLGKRPVPPHGAWTVRPAFRAIYFTFSSTDRAACSVPFPSRRASTIIGRSIACATLGVG